MTRGARTRRLATALALGCAALSATACGRKTAVRPPEMVAPERIADLSAGNVPAGIELRWARPRDYADGSSMLDLGGFRVERSTGGGPFELRDRVSVDDSYRFRQRRRFHYLDGSAEAGQVYRYRIVSFTVDGYTSQPSNQVELVREAPAEERAATPTPGAP